MQASWLVFAFLAPAMWALVNIIDVYFTEEVYKDEYDGVIISGLFNIIPWIAVPFVGFNLPNYQISLLAIFGGLMFSLSTYFYFKSLLSTSDAALVETMQNGSAVLVPVLAFMFIGEKLSDIQYMGIAVTFLGGTFLSFGGVSGENGFKKIFFLMLGAITFLSISMVTENIVYDHVDFFDGFLMFSVGVFLGGVSFYSLRRIQGKTGHLMKLNKKYAGWFFMAESLALLGIFCSQKAISMTPSVSFVAVIESLIPAFVIIQSAIIFMGFKIFSANGKIIMQRIHGEQISGWRMKSIAIVVMAIGIYIINA